MDQATIADLAARLGEPTDTLARVVKAIELFPGVVPVHEVSSRSLVPVATAERLFVALAFMTDLLRLRYRVVHAACGGVVSDVLDTELEAMEFRLKPFLCGISCPHCDDDIDDPDDLGIVAHFVRHGPGALATLTPRTALGRQGARDDGEGT